MPDVSQLKMTVPEMPNLGSWIPARPEWMSVQALKDQLPLGPLQDLQNKAKYEGQFQGSVRWIRENRLALGAGLAAVIVLQPMLSPYRTKALIRNTVFLGGAGFCVLCPGYALVLGRSIKRDVLLDSAHAACPPLKKVSLRWPREAESEAED